MAKSKRNNWIIAIPLAIIVLFLLSSGISYVENQRNITLSIYNNYVSTYQGGLEELENLRLQYNSIQLSDATFSSKVQAANNYASAAKQLLLQIDDFKAYISAHQTEIENAGINTALVITSLSSDKILISDNANQMYSQLNAFSAEKEQQQQLLLTLLKLVTGFG